MRLIDADALCRIPHVKETNIVIEQTHVTDCTTVVDLSTILNAPTIDAVTVVYCKDCKYRCDNMCPWYNDGITVVQPNDYCSFGEHK